VFTRRYRSDPKNLTRKVFLTTESPDWTGLEMKLTEGNKGNEAKGEAPAEAAMIDCKTL
jgi:hypothetical protein